MMRMVRQHNLPYTDYCLKGYVCVCMYMHMYNVYVCLYPYSFLKGSTFLVSIIIYYSVCACAWHAIPLHTEVRRLSGVSFLLPPIHRFWGLNAVRQSTFNPLF